MAMKRTFRSGFGAGFGTFPDSGGDCFGRVRFPFTESLEHKLYDLRVRSAKVPPPSDDIRLVAIDASSIEAIGRWPWPRSVVADLLNRIAAGEPRALGCAIIFSEPDENHGLTRFGTSKTNTPTSFKPKKKTFRPLLLRLAKDPAL
jgi:hypothetical protein